MNPSQHRIPRRAHSGAPPVSRREMLAWTTKAVIAGALGPRVLARAARPSEAQSHGVITGEPAAERVGARVLADGGNAVDAIVAAALTAAVSAPQMTGMGGYGGHLIVALADGKVSSIDFNTRAPAAARDAMFLLDEKGNVRVRANTLGWLAAGVPGVLAGLQLALERYGTRSFRESVGPATELARNGFKLSAGLARIMRGCAAQFEADEGSRKLFLPGGQPLAAGDTLRNPDLAALLTTLAERDSVESFYRGDIAQRIADAFKKHGGLVTAEDLAAYRAREVQPLTLAWRGFDVLTAPLTAGGLTVLQALAILRALEWDKLGDDFARTHSYIEALRFAWHDRLRLLGDPGDAGELPARLLSPDYAGEAAARIRQVVKEGSFLPLQTGSRPQSGTINLSAVDRHGNMAVCTFTHGGSFGARVTVDGLGLTLGHGMSRFEPRPGHPNSPGPGKHPLNNMCPTIVLREGQPVFGLGGRGGRKIPNALFAALTRFVALGANMPEALAAPRLHTEGSSGLEFEKAWCAADLKALAGLGYKVKLGTAATLSVVSFDPRTGECRAAMR